MNSLHYRRAEKEMHKTSPNIPKVIGLLEAGLSEGDPNAAYALYSWHRRGHHVKQDLKRALQLLRLAAKGKVPSALFDLAATYEAGKELTKNDRLAFNCYIEAALYGDKQAIYEVGRCYYYGIGIARDRKLAWIWLDLARKLRRDRARKLRRDRDRARKAASAGSNEAKGKASRS